MMMPQAYAMLCSRRDAHCYGQAYSSASRECCGSFALRKSGRWRWSKQREERGAAVLAFDSPRIGKNTVEKSVLLSNDSKTASSGQESRGTLPGDRLSIKHNAPPVLEYR